MPLDTPAAGTTDVPAQIFDQFLANLEAEKIPNETVAGLRKTLVDDHVFTEAALRKAVLGEEVEA